MVSLLKQKKTKGFLKRHPAFNLYIHEEIDSSLTLLITTCNHNPFDSNQWSIDVDEPRSIKFQFESLKDLNNFKIKEFDINTLEFMDM